MLYLEDHYYSSWMITKHIMNELPTVEFAKENDVIMLCLPPHSTHASQPLDTCVFNPLKNSGIMVANGTSS